MKSKEEFDALLSQPRKVVERKLGIVMRNGQSIQAIKALGLWIFTQEQTINTMQPTRHHGTQTKLPCGDDSSDTIGHSHNSRTRREGIGKPGNSRGKDSRIRTRRGSRNRQQDSRWRRGSTLDREDGLGPSGCRTFLELFCGSKQMSTTFASHGFDTLTIDNEPSCEADITCDILLLPEHFEGIDVLWASPPCTAFSVASIGRNWNKGTVEHTPKTDKARLGIALVEKTVRIITKTKPTKWYIENPRGMFRKIIPQVMDKYGITEYRRVTVTYCQYGEKNMKPTDIITNDFDWQPRPHCKNGDPCHEKAPRGSRTGTQGIKGARNRARIPLQLCEELAKVCEETVL